MAAVLAKHLSHEVGSAVDHLGLVVIVRRTVDKPDQLDNLLDLLKVATARRLGLGKDVEATSPGTLVSLIGVVLSRDLANVLELAVDHGDLPSDIDVLASDDIGHIVGCWGGCLGCT